MFHCDCTGQRRLESLRYLANTDFVRLHQTTSALLLKVFKANFDFFSKEIPEQTLKKTKNNLYNNLTFSKVNMNGACPCKHWPFNVFLPVSELGSFAIEPSLLMVLITKFFSRVKLVSPTLSELSITNTISRAPHLFSQSEIDKNVY